MHVWRIRGAILRMGNRWNKPVSPAIPDQNGRPQLRQQWAFNRHPASTPQSSDLWASPTQAGGRGLPSILAPPALAAFAFHTATNYPFGLASVRCCAARDMVYMRFTLPNLFFF